METGVGKGLSRLAFLVSPLVLVSGLGYLLLFSPLLREVVSLQESVFREQSLVDGYRRAIESRNQYRDQFGRLSQLIRTEYKGMEVVSSAEASNRLQAAVRELLQENGATVSQIRPTTTSNAVGTSNGVILVVIEGEANSDSVGRILYAIETYRDFQIRVQEVRVSRMQKAVNQPALQDNLDATLRMQLRAEYMVAR
ncbi:hypothetical protein [Pyruvatibacter mobilis]|uniref:hypothetical protein n=1 Tax=Pyruvatibacter mobilis TaxID=1712261 RepID=UPI003BAC368C